MLDASNFAKFLKLDNFKHYEQGPSQAKSSETLLLHTTGNYVHNKSSQKTHTHTHTNAPPPHTQEIIAKQLHINGNCAPLKVGIVDSYCLWKKRGKISASPYP